MVSFLCSVLQPQPRVLNLVSKMSLRNGVLQPPQEHCPLGPRGHRNGYLGRVSNPALENLLPCATPSHAVMAAPSFENRRPKGMVSVAVFDLGGTVPERSGGFRYGSTLRTQLVLSTEPACTPQIATYVAYGCPQR
ncbi:unnamed protein product [Ectocarpus sp. 13 AM-2016]